jgi:hypothetical protein
MAATVTSLVLWHFPNLTVCTSNEKCTYISSIKHPAINAPTFLQLYSQQLMNLCSFSYTSTINRPTFLQLYIQQQMHLYSFSYTSKNKCIYIPSVIHPKISAPIFLQLYNQQYMHHVSAVIQPAISVPTSLQIQSCDKCSYGSSVWLLSHLNRSAATSL